MYNFQKWFHTDQECHFGTMFFFNNVLKCPCSNKLRQFQAPLCRSQEGRGGLKIEPISSTLCKHTPYRLPWRQSDVKVNSNSKKRNCSGAVLSEKNWRETLIYKHFMNRLYHYSFVFAPGATSNRSKTFKLPAASEESTLVSCIWGLQHREL